MSGLITVDLLRALAPSGDPNILDGLAVAMQAQLELAGIDTPLRVAHFLGQAVYETSYCSRLTENLNYHAARIAAMWPRLADRTALLAGNPPALANAVYANRFGNGDEANGDGWRYRGRGCFQLTFKANYQEFGYVNNPDFVGTPTGAVESACKFWAARKVNAAADADDTAQVTRIVNGGNAGEAERDVIKRQAYGMLSS